MATRDIPVYLGLFDAYLAWGFRTNFLFVAQVDGVVGLIIQWRSRADATEASRIVDGYLERGLSVPDFYRAGPGGAARLVWALSVPKTEIAAFLADVYQLAWQIQLAAPYSSPVARGTSHSNARSKRKVLAAVLDDGCAFANSRFRRPSGTRVVWLWNQNPTGAPSGSQLVFTGYGTQWSAADLDAVFPATTDSEAEAYAEVELAGLRRAAVHGTHVMDLLAGAEKKWDIVFVQFPQIAVNDPSGRWLERFGLDGLLYAIECAGKKTKTIVVNLSWGPQTGPHDGTSPFEAAIEDLVAEQAALSRRLIVTLAAGNSYEARSHAEIDCVAGGSCDWLVPPDGSLPPSLELWWPPGIALADARLRVYPPAGAGVDIGVGHPPPADPSWSAAVVAVAGAVMGRVIVNPTGAFGLPLPPGQDGRWRIEIDPSPSTGQTGKVHLYVERADHNMGAVRRAKPSYLSDQAHEDGRFVAPADRHEEASGSVVRKGGTLSGLATGESSFVAGGYVFSTGECARYSSAGPTRGNRVGPDYGLVTDRSEVLLGLRAAGVRSGTKAVLVGTSTAAPQLGRKLVNNSTNVTRSPCPPEHVGKGLLTPESGVV